MSARRSVWSVARKILFGLGRLVFYALVEGPVFGILAASLNALMIVIMGDFVDFFMNLRNFGRLSQHFVFSRRWHISSPYPVIRFSLLSLGTFRLRASVTRKRQPLRDAWLF